MADKSTIEWTEATWTIVQGCDPVSQGCVRCYAVPLIWRLMHNPNPKISGPLKGLVEEHVNRAGEKILRFTGKVALREDRLDWPHQWKKPRLIFVPSHGDVFHKTVPLWFIAKIWNVMHDTPRHTYQVLTKRSERMRAIVNQTMPELPNVWLGVSIENRDNLHRIDDLRKTKARIRFLSVEPLLEDLGEVNLEGIHWVIVGGESGAGARPMYPAWARSLRDQCAAAGVLFFFKQWGEWHPDGQLWADGTHGLAEGGTIGFGLAGKKQSGRFLDGIKHNGMPA